MGENSETMQILKMYVNDIITLRVARKESTFYKSIFLFGKKTMNESYTLYLLLKYRCYNHNYIILS